MLSYAVGAVMGSILSLLCCKFTPDSSPSLPLNPWAVFSHSCCPGTWERLGTFTCVMGSAVSHPYTHVSMGESLLIPGLQAGK